jgi:hypothetical protein
MDPSVTPDGDAGAGRESFEQPAVSAMNVYKNEFFTFVSFQSHYSSSIASALPMERPACGTSTPRVRTSSSTISQYSSLGSVPIFSEATASSSRRSHTSRAPS